MVKVFLVEDESISGVGSVITLIGKVMDLNSLGSGRWGICLSADFKNKTDILITDIKMPFIDGLQLSRLVKKNLPKTRIIVLSGYNEFDYAKEAIKIGISDYLLKPVTSVSLMDTLKHVADKIREEQENSRLLERYFASYEKYTEFLDNTNIQEWTGN